MIEGRPIGYEYAHQSLTAWVKNFDGILNHDDLLADFINGLEFISDDSIRCKALDFVNKNLPGDEIYYTSLGEENESSARLVSVLNTKQNYSRDIFSLLEKLDSQNVFRARIVFIDDFLNSGGQFVGIINSWFDKKVSARRNISERLLELLKKSELYFIFAYGMEKGRMRGEQEIVNLKLKGHVHIITQYADNHGIFGSDQNIENIENNCEFQVEAETLFKNYTCREVHKFYDICKEAGKQLYEQYKPEHDQEKKEKRILGYGNSAQLFIGQNNIPTCTLTCLWLEGEVVYQGQKIKWSPIFRRREKAVGGSEGDKIKMSLAEKLSHSYLDLSKNREPVLEISLSDSLAEIITDFPEERWRDASEDSLEVFNPLLKEFLCINKSSYIRQLKPLFFRKINRLKFFTNSDAIGIDVKISNITVTTFNCLKTFLQINFQFTASKIDLKTALEINSLVAYKQNRRDSSFFRLTIAKEKHLDFGTYQLFTAISRNLNKNMALSYCDIDLNEKFKKAERYIQFSYLRENGDYFKSTIRQLNDLIKLASDFSLPKDENLNTKDSFKSVELSIEANISYSHKGMVFIGSAIHKNSNINRYFFLSYGLGYHLVLHIENLISEYQLTFFKNTERTMQLRNWLERFILFPFDKISTRDYLNQYLAESSKFFKIDDSLSVLSRLSTRT